MSRLTTVILATGLVFGVAAVGRFLRRPPAHEASGVVVPARPGSALRGSAAHPGDPAGEASVSSGPGGSFPVLLPPSPGSTGVQDPGAQPFATREGEPMTGVTVGEPTGAAQAPAILGVNGTSR